MDGLLVKRRLKAPSSPPPPAVAVPSCAKDGRESWPAESAGEASWLVLAVLAVSGVSEPCWVSLEEDDRSTVGLCCCSAPAPPPRAPAPGAVVVVAGPMTASCLGVMGGVVAAEGRAGESGGDRLLLLAVAWDGTRKEGLTRGAD